MVNLNAISLSVSPEALAILTFMSVAVVKLVHSAFIKDWEACAKIVGAGVTGGIVALFVPNVTGMAGVLIGLGGSGIITAASFLSSTTVVSSPVVSSPVVDPNTIG